MSCWPPPSPAGGRVGRDVRARWAAVLFLLLAVWNIGLLVYAVTGMDQKPIAVILALVSVAVPAICAVLLWWRGEYRAPRRQSAVAGDTGPWTV